MSHLLVQAFVTLLSLSGAVALIPGPDSQGTPRIKGALGNAITYVGIVLLLAPWVVAPFLPQTRLVGWAGALAIGIGATSGVAGVALYIMSLRVLLPAFHDRFSEFTPAQLVVDGPYRHLRHPIYLSCLIILASLYLVLRAAESALFLPFCYLLLRVAAVYEEKRILLPKFAGAYRQYSRRVRPAIFGIRAGLALGLLYVIVAGATVAYLAGVDGIMARFLASR